jgi:hypothetical protein
MKRKGHHGGARRGIPLTNVMVFVLLLFLFSGYVVSVTRGEEGGGRHAGSPRAAQIADRAEGTLATFNRTIAAVVLIGGALFTIFRVRKSSKTRARKRSRMCSKD